MDPKSPNSILFVPRMSGMELTEFHAALKQLTPDDIHDRRASLASDTAGDEVDAWHATIAHRPRAPPLAPHAASRARGMGRRADRPARRREPTGCELPDADVTHVARAAAEVARGHHRGRRLRARGATAPAALVPRPRTLH